VTTTIGPLLGLFLRSGGEKIFFSWLRKVSIQQPNFVGQKKKKSCSEVFRQEDIVKIIVGLMGRNRKKIRSALKGSRSLVFESRMLCLFNNLTCPGKGVGPRSTLGTP
jgi:hypothetical protein